MYKSVCISEKAFRPKKSWKNIHKYIQIYTFFNKINLKITKNKSIFSYVMYICISLETLVIYIKSNTYERSVCIPKIEVDPRCAPYVFPKTLVFYLDFGTYTYRNLIHMRFSCLMLRYQFVCISIFLVFYDDFRPLYI